VRLTLTAEQAAQIEPIMRHDFALLGRIQRETFNGGNAETSGALIFEFGAVPEIALPALRDAIKSATIPPKRKAKLKTKAGVRFTDR
jgi:hypothetical protein